MEDPVSAPVIDEFGGYDIIISFGGNSNYFVIKQY